MRSYLVDSTCGVRTELFHPVTPEPHLARFGDDGGGV